MKRLVIVSGVILVLVAVATVRSAPPPPPSNELLQLRKLPPLPHGSVSNYRVDPYIIATEKLQTLGMEKAVAVLRKVAIDPDEDKARVILPLCRMLFSAKSGRLFRQPMLGAPLFVGFSKASNWPSSPIELIDGVPFAVNSGYMLTGLPESPSDYLNYCVQECEWTSTRFTQKNAQEKARALEKLFSSSNWKEPLSEDEKAFFAAQLSSLK